MEVVEMMKVINSEYILKVEQTGFPDALGVQCKRGKSQMTHIYWPEQLIRWVR